MLQDTGTKKEKAVENPLHWIQQRIRENSLFSLSLFMNNVWVDSSLHYILWTGQDVHKMQEAAE